MCFLYSLPHSQIPQKENCRRLLFIFLIKNIQSQDLLLLQGSIVPPSTLEQALSIFAEKSTCPKCPSKEHIIHLSNQLIKQQWRRVPYFRAFSFRKTLLHKLQPISSVIMMIVMSRLWVTAQIPTSLENLENLTHPRKLSPQLSLSYKERRMLIKVWLQDNFQLSLIHTKNSQPTWAR